jgi:hypothetical protein
MNGHPEVFVSVAALDHMSGTGNLTSVMRRPTVKISHIQNFRRLDCRQETSRSIRHDADEITGS